MAENFLVVYPISKYCEGCPQAGREFCKLYYFGPKEGTLSEIKKRAPESFSCSGNSGNGVHSGVCPTLSRIILPYNCYQNLVEELGIHTS